MSYIKNFIRCRYAWSGRRSIIVGVGSQYLGGVAGEASGAYKDVTQVVGATHNTGISRIVTRTKPIAVIKG